MSMTTTMSRTKKIILKVLGGFVIAYFAVAVLASEGTVVDEKGKPVKGAYIIAYWSGVIRLPVQPHSTCYNLEATTTDENGRFRVSTFSVNLNPFMFDRHRSIGVFFPGYTLSPETNRDDLRFVVIPLNGVRSDQFKSVERFYRGGSCGNEKAQLPMLKARYAELIKLAETQEEKKISESFLFGIEETEFGRDVAVEKSIQRERELKRLSSEADKGGK